MPPTPNTTIRTYSAVADFGPDNTLVAAHIDLWNRSLRIVGDYLVTAAAWRLTPAWADEAVGPERAQRRLFALSCWVTTDSIQGDFSPQGQVLGAASWSPSSVGALLRERGVGDAEGWLGDCGPWLSARRREGAVLVNRVAERPEWLDNPGWDSVLGQLLPPPGVDREAGPQVSRGLFSAWMGDGEKSDWPGLVEALHELAGRVAAGGDGLTVAEALASVSVEAWVERLGSYKRGGGPQPAVPRRLVAFAETPLGAAATKSETVRDRLAQAIAEYAQRAETAARVQIERADAEARGLPVALAGLLGQVTGPTGFPENIALLATLLSDAASVVSAWRAKQWARAGEWVAAQERLRATSAETDPATVAAITSWLTEQATAAGVPVYRLTARMVGRNVAKLAAELAQADSAPERQMRLAAAYERGAATGSRPLWTWLAGDGWEAVMAGKSPGARLSAVVVAHSAANRLERLSAATLTLPDPEAHPRGPWWGTAKLPGGIGEDGTIVIRVWDPVARSLVDVSGRWDSDRIHRQLLPPKQSDATPVTRNDRTSRLAAKVTAGAPVAVAVDLSTAAIQVSPRQRGRGWSVHVAVRLEMPVSLTTRFDLGARVLGVHLGVRRDAAFAVLESVAGEGGEAGLRFDVGKGRFALCVRRGLLDLGGQGCAITAEGLAPVWSAVEDLDGFRPPSWVAQALAAATKADRADAVRAAYNCLGSAIRDLAALRRVLAAEGGAAEAVVDLAEASRRWPLPAGCVSAEDARREWARRSRAVGRLLSAVADLTFSAHHGLGVSLARVEEIATLDRLYKSFHASTSNHPETATGAPRLAAKRLAVRRNWARSLASTIVQTALSHDCGIIAMESLDLMPSTTRSRGENRLIARWAYREVHEWVEQLASLHGLTVRWSRYSRSSTIDARTGEAAIRWRRVPAPELGRALGSDAWEEMSASPPKGWAEAIERVEGLIAANGPDLARLGRDRSVDIPSRLGPLIAPVGADLAISGDGTWRISGATDAEMNAAVNVGLSVVRSRTPATTAAEP